MLGKRREREDMSKGREGTTETIWKRRQRGAGGEWWGRGERGERDGIEM